MLAKPNGKPPVIPRDPPADRIVLVLQGGGALGAYQAGTYQALHEAGLEPDWVIGTSIGAINGSIIAGNAVEDRLTKLQAFWQRMTIDGIVGIWSTLPMVGPALASWGTVTGGLPNFFVPNPMAFFSNEWPLSADAAGYYSTQPLRRTLGELVDFDRINGCETRLTVGAANVGNAMMHYFDSRDMRFTVDHIMASGALPPAFPAVRIDGQLFWDGGILSNTPVEAVFDDNPRRSALVFVVHVWNPNGPEPTTVKQVMTRQKDVQYASRARSHIMRQKQIHRLRHVIAELVKKLPEEARTDNEVQKLASFGCLTRMHIVRLLAPIIGSEDHTKDIDFTESGIRARWHAGYTDTTRVLERAPWHDPVDPLEGFILHEAEHGAMISTS
ncbi:MAG TPA: patatin-like phospholipase family protein [Acetobacteraceae bacterium]|nr:patatin-like phospholipase family protein [Acetobacteraceae bacterium]